MFGRPPCSCVLQGISDARRVVYIPYYRIIPAVHSHTTYVSINRPLDLQSLREYKVVPESGLRQPRVLCPFL